MNPKDRKPSGKLSPIDPPREKKALFLFPDLSDTAASRERVGKYLNAETHPVHVEGDGEQRRLVTRGGTDVREHVRNTNGHVFYEAHGGSSRQFKNPDGTKQRTLEFADQHGQQHFYGQDKASTTLANSLAETRSVTLFACKYGLGKGSALQQTQEKMASQHPGTGTLPSIFAPKVNFLRQTLPGPGIDPPPGTLKKIPVKERGRTTMMHANNQELHDLVGNPKFWAKDQQGGTQLPVISETTKRVAKTDTNAVAKRNKTPWRI